MKISFGQLQIAALTAPALMALLLLPGVAINHPALIAHSMVAPQIRAIGETGRWGFAEVETRAVGRRPVRLSLALARPDAPPQFLNPTQSEQMPAFDPARLPLSCRAP